MGAAIDPLTLPAATVGDAPLTYSLTPGVPGLSFNTTSRRLSGAPTTAGTYDMTYRVRDVDGDTDTECASSAFLNTSIRSATRCAGSRSCSTVQSAAYPSVTSCERA